MERERLSNQERKPNRQIFGVHSSLLYFMEQMNRKKRNKNILVTKKKFNTQKKGLFKKKILLGEKFSTHQK